MSKTDRFENDLTTGTATGSVLRHVKVFGIKTMTVVVTASMLLSGLPTAAIAEGMEEAGLIATQTEAEQTDQDTAAATDEGTASSTDDAATTTETTDTSDTPAADTSTQQDTSAAQDTPASEEQTATEADVKLDLGSAYITYNDQDIALPSTKVTVPTGKDFKFTVTPNTGFDLTAVKLTVNGTESELAADEDGAYTVTADQVAAGASIKLETEEQAEEAATQNDAIAITSLEDEDASSRAKSSARATSNSGNTATFIPTITNAEVAYFNWHSSSDTRNITFTPVASGSTLSVSDYNSSSQAGYIVFFIKPNSNYLFTGLGADGNGDTYVVGSGSYRNIGGYPNIDVVMTAAKDAGYVAAFGYSSAKRDTPPTNSAFAVTAQSPDMTIAATSNKTSDVLAGETLTFTIVMTPHLTGSNRDKVTDVQVNSVTVNGVPATCSDLVNNGDGTYTATVSYTVTEADCNRSSVDLVVNATSTYEASLSTSLSSITTASSINKTATATCAIAPKSDVTYEFKSGTSGKALPNGIYSLLPKDTKTYQKGKDVTASKTPKSGTVYEDADNDGYWTFEGWDSNKKQMTSDGITFTGTWAFTEYSKYTVKYVDKDGKELADSKTVSGNKVGDVIKKADVEHPEITGYSYSKTNPDKLTISKDESKNVITVVYKQKAGKAGYNLVLDSASWTAPSETTNTEKMKWYYDYGFAKGDTFTVTDSEPTAENHAFIGWLDKKRDDQAATIRESGDKITYIYSDDQTYTLDALWASLSATGEDVTYDGKSHTVTVDVNINEGTGLNSEYVAQAKKLITTSDTEYSIDGGETWSSDKPSFTDAGTYTVEVRQNVTVGNKTTTLTAEATVKIAKRDVTLESADLSKDYDGSALTNGDTSLKTEDGWVKGEGATYSFTGSQTDVGESDNAFSYTLKDNTKASNYNISKSEGTLTVNNRSEKYAITVEGNSTTVSYDGKEHAASGITAASSTYTNDKGVTFTITADTTNPKSTDATTAENKVSNVKVMLGNKDVTKQFKVTTKDGTLTINKRTVKLTSGSAEKEYDGKALKNDKVTATKFNAETGEGFVDGEGATYKVTGSQTKPGSSENTFSYELNENTKADNYTITTEYGTLNVTNRKTKYEITVEGNSATETYDGTEKSVSGIKTTTFTVDGNTYTVEGLEASGAKDTDAGSYANTVTGTPVVKDAEGNDVTSEFAVTVKSGTLKINKRDVTIKSKSAEQVYNGQPLTKHEVEIASGSIADADKDKVAYNFTGTITNVGETPNAFTVSGLVAKNYNVTTETGTLKVTPVIDKVTVTITEHGGSYTYDGTQKAAMGYDVSSSNTLYTAKDFTFSGTAEVKGTNAGTYEMQLKSEDFENTSSNFSSVEFKIVDAKLTIAKREVTLTSATGSKVYDGTALTNKTVIITSGSFVDGQGFTAEATGSVTNVSESEVNNDFTYALTGGATEGEDGNYIITKQIGKLSITPVATEVNVTITGHKTEAKYDGTQKSAKGYDVAISNKLYTEDDFSYIGTSEVEETNAGTYVMGLTKGTFTNNNTNFTNVNFSVTDGELKITKREVTLTSATDSKEYDGTPLTRNEQTDVTVTGDGFADGEGATYTITGTQTVVGNSENTFTYELTGGATEGENGNYVITKQVGTLTVTNRDTKYDVTVKANSATATYDGETHKAEGVETYTFTKNGQEYTVSGLKTEDPEKTDAGTYTNNITGTAKVTDAKGNDVTEQFTVKTENGQLVINKAEVTLKSDSGKWVYDGKTHTAENVTATGFVKGEGATYTYGKSVTNVSDGKVENIFSYTLNADTKADNYTITTEYGTLEVTPVTDKVTVTITGKTKTETFDGSEKTVSGYKFEADNSLYTEGCAQFSGSAVASGTFVNKYDMGLKKGDFENISENFSNVEFAVTDGWLEITPAGIDNNDAEWTKDDVSKVYDGTNLTAFAATAQDKYGNALTVEYSTDGENWVSDPTKISLTHAGEVTVQLRARSDNYKDGEYFTSSETITVTKRKVTMTSATDSKPYDGKALTNNNVTVSEFNAETGEGFVKGEGATYDVTGTITNVGEADNTFTYALKKGTEASDYDITATPGKLTITADATEVVVTIKGNSETVVYDGEEHTVTGYEVTSITGGEGKFTAADVALKDDIDLSVSGTNVAVDAATGTVVAYTKALNASDFKSTNANFSNVKFVIDSSASNVSLTITKRPVTLTSGSATKDYDGAPLTNSEVTATTYDAEKKEGFVGEQGFTATTTGSQTDAGTSKNTFTYELNAGTSATNYSITTVEGDLTVNKLAAANLNLTGTDVSVVYDADSHSAGTATATPKDNNGNVLTDKVTIEYQLASDPYGDWYSDPSVIKQTNATTEPVKVNVRATSPNFEGTATATETIAIEKRDVQLTSRSKTKVYDGTPLTYDWVDMGPERKDTGFIWTDLVDWYHATGSQTNVGSSKNTISYALKKGAEKNYNILPEVLGTLTVTAQSINPEDGDSYTGAEVNDPVDVTYDANAHKWAPTVKNAQGTVLTEGTDYTVEYKRGEDATDDFTNTGTITVVITGTGNYSGTVTKTYKITKAPLKVSTPSASKVYDGTALTAEATSSNITGLVDGETATVKATGSQTEVGSSDNTYDGIEWGNAKESNYYVQSVNEGTLTVVAQSIDPKTDPSDPDKRYTGATVNDPSNTTYSGTEHKWEPTVKNGDGETLEAGKDYTVVYKRDGKETTDFTNAGTITVEITGTGNYAGTVTKEYVIGKAPLTVATAGASKTYDGEPLTKVDGATITGLVNGETAAIAGTGTITEVGETSNTYAITWASKDNDYTAKESNYEVKSETLGTLTVTESADTIVVTTTGGTFTYDGKAHGATVEVTNLPKGYKVKTATSSATATDVTTDDVTATADNLVIVNASGKDVTESLDIKYADGTIKITKAPLTVTTYDNSKVYDGTALTADGKIEGLVNNESAELVTTGSQTTVGNSKNTYKINWNDNAKKSNYEVKTENIGTLTVTPVQVSLLVVPAGATKVYDGEALTSSKANVYGTLPKGYTYEYTLKGSQTDAGWSYVTVDTFKILDKNKKDVTDQFTGYNTEAKGVLTVTPRPVTLTSASDSKVYDGEELVAHSATASKTGKDTGMVAGQEFKYNFTGTQTTVGSSANTFSAKDSSTAKVSNYNITYENGELEVKAQSIDPEDEDTYKKVTINYPTDATYDAAEHKWAPTVKDADGNTLTAGKDYTVTYMRGDAETSDFTNAGTITVVITGTGNYAGIVTRTYKIKKREITVTSADATKVYDGTELVKHEAGVTSATGLAGDEELAYSFTGAQTEVGGEKGNNAFAIDWEKSTAAEGNYKVTLVNGTLTVTAQSINPDDKDAYKKAEIDDPTDATYDGDEHKWVPEVKDGDKVLTEGEDYTVTYKRGDDETDNFTDAGTITVVITGKGNYTGTVTKTYVINKREVTITSDNGDFVYNGKDQKQETASVTDGSFVEGEGVASYTFTKSVKKVGDEADNEFTYTLNDKTKADNYKITLKYGKLTVRKSEDSIVVTLTGYEGAYDGDEHKATSRVVGTLPEGYTTKVVTNESITNVGEKTAKVDCFTIYDENGEDVTDQFNVDNKSTATLKVTEREITVTSADATKVYDGTELVKHEAGVTSAIGLAGDEELAYSFTGAQTEVGGEKGNNAFAIDWEKSTAAEGNYKVTYEPGTLTVAPQSIDPVDPDDPDPSYKGVEVNDPVDVTYDANAHKWAPTVKDADGEKLVAGKDYTVTYKRDGVETTDFTNAGTITVVITGTGNYTGEITKTYTINPAEVTLSSNTREFVYNGSKQSDHAVNGTGAFELFKSQVTLLAATGEVQNVGDTAVNIISYSWKAGFSAGNYIISKAEGNLSVKPQSINPDDVDPDDPDPAYKGVTTDEPTDVTYDGDEHKWVPTVKDSEGKELVEGTDYDVTYDTSDFINTGTITVIITGKGDYTGTITKTYRITPAALHVVTGSASKTYDGSALTNGTVTVTGLAALDTITVTANGSQTEVGDSENTYTIDWMQVNKDNYTVTDELGTLTVVAAPAPDNGGNDGGTAPATPTNNGGTIIDTIVEVLDDGYRAITGDTEEETEKISDTENPLAKADKKKDVCWVHWYMIVCAIATAIYGIFVGLRRTKHTRRLEDDLKDILDNDAESKN